MGHPWDLLIGTVFLLLAIVQLNGRLNKLEQKHREHYHLTHDLAEKTTGPVRPLGGGITPKDGEHE
jgi:hypothetical protein